MKNLPPYPFECPCGHKPVPLIIKKPSPYYGSTVRHICPGCQSEYIIKVLKVKPLEKMRDAYKIFVKNEFTSPKLREAMRKNPETKDIIEKVKV